MESSRLVDLSAFFLDVEVFCNGGKKFLLCEAVEILHYTVVVDDLELAVWESHSHEVVVLLISCMCRILLALFSTHACSGSCTVVSVSDIECRDICKDLSDAVNVCLLADHPEVVSESVFCNEIIFRLLSDVPCNYRIDFSIVRI